MLIRVGYDIELQISELRSVLALLNVHPSRNEDLLEADEIRTSAISSRDEYIDSFGNRCLRIMALPGTLRLWNSTLVADSGQPDPVDWTAPQIPVHMLPVEAMPFLLSSRYCEVDRLSDLAWQLFGNTAPGWPMVQAICDWVHQNVTFGYQFARPTRTALDVSIERLGVCRDFQHLAITLCRAMHIPARYATGYLGDIGVPVAPCPMDFSAWFEVWLGDRWWTFDARHNCPRIGRILMATGRDAADVAITTSFGPAPLQKFLVVTHQADELVAHPNAETTMAA
jgi:transglutaminase-like putative cysteine protease